MGMFLSFYIYAVWKIGRFNVCINNIYSKNKVVIIMIKFELKNS